MPTIFVGNKIDLVSSRVVERAEAQACAESVDAAYIETSAKTGDNICELFENLVLLIAGVFVPDAQRRTKNANQ